MQKIVGLVLLAITIAYPTLANQPLNVVFPPNNYRTTSDRIFFLGTAPATGNVTINGNSVSRSSAGHFAPSLPLHLGNNIFTLRYQNQERQIVVNRVSGQPTLSPGLAFAKDSLTPKVDIARLPGEVICFSAIASPNATVSVILDNQNIPLISQFSLAQIPPNHAALTGQYKVPDHTSLSNGNISEYKGCAKVNTPGNLGKPEFKFTINGKTTTQIAPGNIEILSPSQIQIAEVIADEGIARTGPSTDYSRLTPLPKGVQASVTGREGEWLRLDYGGWISSQEVRIVQAGVPPTTIVRTLRVRQVPGATEILFPLQVAVPISIQQGDRTFTVNLYNTTAQTDTIRLDDDPLISRLDWQQIAPSQVQYTFNLKSSQQWGYQIKYDRANLVLTLRHSPTTPSATKEDTNKPLSGIKILLDPGHGGTESGAAGPTGYLEKDVNLIVSKLVQNILEARGATVYMTRENDTTLSLAERVAMINQLQPAIAISIHHNSLPDNGDAENTQGFSTY